MFGKLIKTPGGTKGAIPYMGDSTKDKPKLRAKDLVSDTDLEKFRKAQKLDSILILSVRGDTLEVNNDGIRVHDLRYYLRGLREVSRMMEDCVDDPAGVMASALSRMMDAAKSKKK